MIAVMIHNIIITYHHCSTESYYVYHTLRRLSEKVTKSKQSQLEVGT